MDKPVVGQDIDNPVDGQEMDKPIDDQNIDSPVYAQSVDGKADGHTMDEPKYSRNEDGRDSSISTQNDPLTISLGPITRSNSKNRTERLGYMIQSMKNEEKLCGQNYTTTTSFIYFSVSTTT